jgi:hypothetical protein
MTSKTTTKATSPKTNRKNSRKKSNRINRQRRLQKQLQILLLERHSRRCIICHHPEREAIEEEFVHWRAPWKLSQDYKLADYRTVYRHARAAGLLLQRREHLHSALDAFVESVDDVTFTGDTILRAMRAYSCIDSHGRWTEIPTQVQFSTSSNAHPPQPSPRATNVSADVIDIDPDEVPEDDTEEDADNAPEERVTALDVLDVIRKYSNQALRSDATACSVSPKIKSRNDATACAAPPAQALDVTEDEYADPENDAEDDDMDDDSDADEESEEESEEDAENALEEFVTSVSTSSKSPSRSDTTACAASPAQAVNVSDFENDPDDEHDPEDDPDDDNDQKNKSEADSLEETAACAAPPAQALPRDVVRGQNPNDRSLSDRTDCAALPRNRPPLKNRSRTPTASYGTHTRAIRIRRCRSQTRRAASATKSI